MKSERRQRRGMMMALGLLAALLLPGSECVSTSSRCMFDSDCTTDAVCVTGECRVICASDEDCATQQDASPDEEIACRPYTRTDAEDEAINVCAPPLDLAPNNEENNTSRECATDEDCVTQFGDDAARCSLLDTCIIPPPEHAVRIEDRSEAGAEILALFAVDVGGEPVAFGVLEAYAPAGEADDALMLNGERPELTEDGQCVASTAAAPATALGGAGGTMRAYFIDDAGQRTLLEPSWRVVVIERGPECAADATSDEYELRLCVSRAGDDVDDATQCGTLLGQGSQTRTEFEVTLP